ncbi:MAG: hypothetical protein OQK61_08420 [Ignavibacteriaceae bacterium]|nr:hypothetical protein [Ignavibacteriaceae bacterium]
MTRVCKVSGTARVAAVMMMALIMLFQVNEVYGKSKKNKVDDTHFAAPNASEDVQRTVKWIGKNYNNQFLPFGVIDKQNAVIHLFSKTGEAVASGPVLLGISKTDRIDPETFKKRLSSIGPSERVTPAGRFQVVLGPDHRGKQVLWVDTKFAIALHPVVNVPGQNRKTRLNSETSSDNRITWGCINVQPTLYKNVISSLFKRQGFVYILPEEVPVEDFIRQVSLVSPVKNK